MSAVAMAEFPPYGHFREGTSVSVVSRSFGWFPRPWVGASLVDDELVVVAYADAAGTTWKSTFDGVAWSTERVVDAASDMYGPEGHWGGVGWADPPVDSGTYRLSYDDDETYCIVTDPYTGQDVTHSLGMVTSSVLPPEFWAGIVGSVTWPTQPSGYRPYIRFLALNVASGSISSNRPGLGSEQVVAIVLYVRDSWSLVSGTWKWVRSYVLSKDVQEQFDGMFPSYPVVTTYWNGPGNPPGSAGVYLADCWASVMIPYNEGGIRVWAGGTTNLSGYAQYLVPSDLDYYLDFQGMLFPHPISTLTWAYAPGSGEANVVHGVDATGSLFSKYFFWRGNNYRVRLSGWPVGLQWVWACHRYPNMILAATATTSSQSHLIAITLPDPPDPPSEEIEPFYPSSVPYPEVPWLPPDRINPPSAAHDARSVMRW